MLVSLQCVMAMEVIKLAFYTLKDKYFPQKKTKAIVRDPQTLYSMFGPMISRM